MFLTRKRLAVLGLGAVCAIGGALFSATLARGNQTPPVAAFTSTSAPPATDTSNIESLAADAGQVPPGAPAGFSNPTGTPQTRDARALITNAGPAHDTLSAFPTSSGWICYEVLGAGGCGDPNKGEPFGAGIIFDILTTRGEGTRLFGVTSDKVVKVDVEITGTDYPATLDNNGFYYPLPNGVSSAQIQSVITTWNDGSVHTFPVHG